MSITLNDLLEWHDRLPEQSGDEAHMLRVLIARRETETRAQIADLIAQISQREGWKLQRCASIARRVEQASIDQLESIHSFFQSRNDGRTDIDVPEALWDFFADQRIAPAVPPVPAQLVAMMQVAPAQSASLGNLHQAMHMLETSIASTPGLTCGVQGIRIMRMVALMSKARSAQIATMRMTGTQAFYRHS